MLAAAFAFDWRDLLDPLLLVGGMLLLPAWLVSSAETMLRTSHLHPAAAEAPA